MKIPQLLQRINAQWPFPGSDALDIAYEDYRVALGRYQGPKLQQAWDETVATWRSANRPLPADILAFVPKGAVAKDAGPRVDWDEVKRIQHGMVTDWWRDNQDAIDGFLDQFDHDDREPLGVRNWQALRDLPATDRMMARRKLSDLLHGRAWLEAQRRHMALAMQGLEVKADDFERIRAQVRSQTGAYPKRARDLGYGEVRGRTITPRYVRQSWNDVQTSLPAGAQPATAVAKSDMPEEQREQSPGPDDALPDGRPMPPPMDDPFGIEATA